MALKRKVKLSKKVQKIFSGTEVGVLVEDFTSQVKLVAEDVSGLHNKVDRIEKDVDILKKDVAVIKVKVNKNTDDITVIKTNIEFIKDGLKKKVDYEEFTALERRVAYLENRR